MVGKRTTRSYTFKQYQLQQEQQSSSKSEELPLFHSDLSNFNPALANMYEGMTSIALYLQATNSPILSPLLNIRTQLEQYVNNLVLADWIARSTPSPVLKPPTPDIPSVSFSPDDAIFSALESLDRQAELNCSLLEQLSPLCSQVLELKTALAACQASLATCEAENIRLDNCLRASKDSGASGAIATTTRGPARLYIGNLPFQAGSDELRAFFLQHGPVTDAKVIMDKDSCQSRGFGFVTLPSMDIAHSVLKSSAGQPLCGKVPRCTVINDNNGYCSDSYGYGGYDFSVDLSVSGPPQQRGDC